MSYDRDIQRLANAIRDAARCPMYAVGEIEGCEGLDGCDDCLEYAARAALKVVAAT